MFHYSIFGGRLRSELELLDLPATAAGDPDWSFACAAGPPASQSLELLGEQRGDDAPAFRLYRTAAGLRLAFGADYHFDLARGGRHIIWYPAQDNLEENVRALLLGPVLALALHLQATLCLHGSAVAIGQQAVAFLAPKYQGKSTLGLALSLAGARLLTDDCVAVDLEPAARVRPGVHSVRLWDDSAASLDLARAAGTMVGGLKKTVTRLPADLLQTQPVPLAALYLLVPVRPEGPGAAAARFLLPRPLAAVQLAGHTKLSPLLLGQEMAGTQLGWAAELSRSVPVYSLALASGYDHLAAATDRILGWHPAAPSDHPVARPGG